ncbi:hypothetical protein [Neorhizobium sp. LjRoot104]|uniref:hypothetical protein n=1 Tax=Neorhizobium sp. LjRoot104 TaxID=3342254 RepID=UPI003ECDAE09
MRAFWVALGLVAVSAGVVDAGFQAWTVDSEDDPFSKGTRVTVDFMSSLRSGVLFICDSAESGLLIRAIPGFAHEPILKGIVPKIEIAIDGKLLFGQDGETGAVGDNLAVSQTMLSPDNAKSFATTFSAATKQIAIKDGISDRPHLLTARGSTKAGKALVACMERQKP